MTNGINDKIREHLRTGNIHDALEELLLLLKINTEKADLPALKEYYRRAIALNARLRNLEEEQEIGIIDPAFIQAQKSKIGSDILTLVDTLAHEFPTDPEKLSSADRDTIEITLDRRFEQFNKREKEEFLKKLKEALGPDVTDITIKRTGLQRG